MEKKSFKKTFWRVLPFAILLILLLLVLTCCGHFYKLVFYGLRDDIWGYPEKSAQKVKNTFAGLPKTTDQIVYLTGKYIYVGDQMTPLEEITYNGKEIEPIVCLDVGLYAYTYEEKAPENAEESYDKNLGGTVNVLLVPYDTLTPACVGTLTVEYDLRSVGYDGGKLFFRGDDPVIIRKGIVLGKRKIPDDYHQLFYLFDVTTGETSVVDSNDVGLDYMTNSRLDHNRSERYAPELKEATGFKIFIATDKIKITDLETGKSKEFDEKIIKKCAEGKAIWKAARNGADVFFGYHTPVYEKDGDFYFFVVASYEEEDDYRTFRFVMKYEFDTGDVSFVTWYHVENGQGDLDIYVP